MLLCWVRSVSASRSTPDGTLMYPVPATVNIDGRITDAADATVSVFDHGFLFGDGVYETIRTYNRMPFLLPPHLPRLRASAASPPPSLLIPLESDNSPPTITLVEMAAPSIFST